MIKTNGDLSPCCLMSFEHTIRREDGTAYNINDDDVWENHNSKMIIDLKSDLLSGKEPEACKKCFDREKVGIVSQRQFLNDEWQGLDVAEGDYLSFDLRLNNVCNLSCASCCPSNSSKHAKIQGVKFDGSYVIKWKENGIKNLFKKMPSVIDLYFGGGEPFLQREHYEILNSLRVAELSKNVVLRYNTNMTFVPDTMRDIWREFKEVRIAASLDGVGDVNESIRVGSSWKKVHQNVLKILSWPEVSLLISCTVSKFSIFRLHELINYASENGIKLKLKPLTSPVDHSIKGLTASEKATIKHNLQSVSHPEVESILRFME
jgi:sulfatase maturation enzyme AslB (radical SAM superfamily)